MPPDNNLPPLPDDYAFVYSTNQKPVVIPGGHATVYKVQHKRTATFCAVKVANSSKGSADRLRDELTSYKQIGEHDFLPRFKRLRLASGQSDLIAIANWCGHSLETLSTHPLRASLTPAVILTICRQSAEALQHIHSRSFLHRDISPSNILYSIDHDRTALIDLGLAISIADAKQLQNKPHADHHGTTGYTAPEIADTGYSFASDIYSLAKTLLTLAETQAQPKHPLCLILNRFTKPQPNNRPDLAHLLQELASLQSAGCINSTISGNNFTDAEHNGYRTQRVLPATLNLSATQRLQKAKKLLESDPLEARAQLEKIPQPDRGEQFWEMHRCVQKKCEDQHTKKKLLQTATSKLQTNIIEGGIRGVDDRKNYDLTQAHAIADRLNLPRSTEVDLSTHKLQFCFVPHGNEPAPEPFYISTNPAILQDVKNLKNAEVFCESLNARPMPVSYEGCLSYYDIPSEDELTLSSHIRNAWSSGNCKTKVILARNSRPQTHPAVKLELKYNGQKYSLQQTPLFADSSLNCDFCIYLIIRFKPQPLES